MGLVIHHEKIGAAEAEQLVKVCPFGAIEMRKGE